MRNGLNAEFGMRKVERLEVGMRRLESLASQISHRHTQTHTDNFLSKAVLSVLVRVCLWPIIQGMRKVEPKNKLLSW